MGISLTGAKPAHDFQQRTLHGFAVAHVAGQPPGAGLDGFVESESVMAL